MLLAPNSRAAFGKVLLSTSVRTPEALTSYASILVVAENDSTPPPGTKPEGVGMETLPKVPTSAPDSIINSLPGRARARAKLPAQPDPPRGEAPAPVLLYMRVTGGHYRYVFRVDPVFVIGRRTHGMYVPVYGRQRDVNAFRAGAAAAVPENRLAEIALQVYFTGYRKRKAAIINGAVTFGAPFEIRAPALPAAGAACQRVLTAGPTASPSWISSRKRCCR